MTIADRKPQATQLLALHKELAQVLAGLFSPWFRLAEPGDHDRVSPADCRSHLVKSFKRACHDLVLRRLGAVDQVGHLLLPAIPRDVDSDAATARGSRPRRGTGVFFDVDAVRQIRSQAVEAFKKLDQGRASGEPRHMVQIPHDKAEVLVLRFEARWPVGAPETWYYLLEPQVGPDLDDGFPWAELLRQNPQVAEVVGSTLIPLVRFATGMATGLLRHRVSPLLLGYFLGEGDLYELGRRDAAREVKRGGMDEAQIQESVPTKPPIERTSMPACVLLMDIRSSTRLMLFTDTEAVFRDYLHKFAECIPKIVKEYGGFYDKFTGDGAMAVFPEGWSHLAGHGDHRVAACMAAMKIRQACVKIFDAWAKDVAYRWEDGETTYGVSMGIDEGQITWEHVHGTEITVIGKPVVFAARLCSKADAWEILVNNRPAQYLNSHGMGHGFQLREKRIETKDFKEKVIAYALLDSAWCGSGHGGGGQGSDTQPPAGDAGKVSGWFAAGAAMRVEPRPSSGGAGKGGGDQG